GAASHEIHLSHGRRRSLPLYHLEIVTMIRLTSLCLVAFFQGFRDFFSNRPFPGSVGVLPCQTIVFAKRAEDSLRVLVHFGVIVFFLSILVLCLDETTTNLNGVQFVLADAPI